MMRWLYSGAERLMAMDDSTWERHANPWSVYTRVPILPCLALSVWSRVWIGWGSVVAVVLVLVWTYLNPRVFPAPKDQNTWASRGVLGERVFLKRRAEVAPHHLRWANALAIASLPGLVVLVLGVWQLKAEWAIFGTALTMGPKLWFVHRMGWLYADWLAEHKKELGDV